MPSFWTHYAFAVECRAMLPSSELGVAIDRHPHAYHAGMQGPDPFLFYLPALLRKKRISTALHTESPDKLLTCLWRQAARAKGEDRSVALAYAAGFWGHYCLDSETHPFVYAVSGIERSTACYCIHNALEADLNRLTVKRYFHKDLAALALPDVYRLPENEAACIAKMLCRTIEGVYGIACSPSAVIRALKAVRAAYKLLGDRSGRKAAVVRTLEKPLRLPYLSPLFLGESHYYPDAANLAHRKWKDPYTGEVSDADFFMLYDKAKEKYAQTLAELRSLDAREYAHYFANLCKRDFHGEPTQKN